MYPSLTAICAPVPSSGSRSLKWVSICRYRFLTLPKRSSDMSAQNLRAEGSNLSRFMMLPVVRLFLDKMDEVNKLVQVRLANDDIAQPGDGGNGKKCLEMAIS